MEITFNIYSVVLLFGVVHGWLYAALLTIRGIKNERLSDILLGALLVATGMELVPYMLGFLNINVLWNELFFFPHDLGLLIGPLFYYYFISQTNAAFRFRTRHLLQLLPFLGVTLYHLLIFSLGKDAVMEWDNAFHRPLHIGTIEKLMYLVSNICYFVLSWRYYIRYTRWTPTMFAATESISFSWYRNLLWALAIGIVASWAMRFMDDQWQLAFHHDWWDKVIIVAIVYYLSIAGYAQKQSQRLFFVPENTAIEMPDAIPTVNIDSMESADPLLKEEITNLLSTDKIYRRNDLSLPEMARLLHTNTSKLSAAINTGFGKNFNDLINAYRVEEVKQLIDEGSHTNFSLLGIALDSGFNSKATFNRVFKKMTGMTPNEYVKQRHRK